MYAKYTEYFSLQTSRIDRDLVSKQSTNNQYYEDWLPVHGPVRLFFFHWWMQCLLYTWFYLLKRHKRGTAKKLNASGLLLPASCQLRSSIACQGLYWHTSLRMNGEGRKCRVSPDFNTDAPWRVLHGCIMPPPCMCGFCRSLSLSCQTPLWCHPPSRKLQLNEKHTYCFQD